MNYTAELADTVNQYLANMGFQTDPIVGQVIISVLILILSLIIGWLVYFIFKHFFSRWAKKTKTTLDDEILKNIRLPIYLAVLVIGLYYALTPLSFIRPYENEVALLFSIIEILLVTFAINRVINVMVAWYADRGAKRKKEMSAHLLFLMKKLLHAVVYLFAILFVLYAFDINLSGAIVGLGVGGIAIAFALQNVLSDMFSAFTIYFDRPFEIGDFVILGADAGTVKKIGIISTRIQTLQGEELIVSNQELVTTRIRNFKTVSYTHLTLPTN